MLCPEVWKFSPPSSQFSSNLGNCNENLSLCSKLIDSHHFNHLVSVVLPNTLNVPDTITETLSQDNEYYNISNIDISELTNKAFINAFIKKGHLSVLSHNRQIDLDDCVCVTPSGHLVLSLQRQTYLELGLEGKPSFFCHKKPTRYVVCVDLKADYFTPGKKNYERVQWCLTEKFKHKFDLLVAWEPTEEKICPSSVAAYLSSRGYSVSLCQPRFMKRLDYNMAVPLLGKEDEGNFCSSPELLEWLGMFSIGGDLKYGSPDNFVNTYEIPIDSQTYGQVTFLQWTGLFTTTKIRMLFETIRDYTAQREDIPWASMYVQGFADSPVSWDLKEHNFYTDGDNSYTLFLQPSGKFLACSVLSSNKRPKT